MALILVLDDDRDMRELIAAALGRTGHEVAVAGEVAEAEEQMARRLPDLILLDLLLEGEHGMVYLGELTQNHRTKEIPVIVVSALRQKRRIVEGLKAGAIDYITKPFDLVELQVRVTAALKVHDLRQEQIRNQKLEAMRETARTVQYEIELPMREIQRSLLQLRNESEDFMEADQALVNQAWDHYSKLESVLAEVQRTGDLKPKSGSSPSP